MPSNEQDAIDRSECVIRGLTSPPVIPTNRTPEEIIGDDWLDIYITHLTAYKKSGYNWGQYASKNLSMEERGEFVRIINELQQNGFYDPHVVDGKIRCYTLVVGRKPKDRLYGNREDRL